MGNLSTETEMTNVTNAILDFESGMLSDEEVIDLFQYLVDTNLAWQLQGSYGRMANALVEEGWVTVSK